MLTQFLRTTGSRSGLLLKSTLITRLRCLTLFIGLMLMAPLVRAQSQTVFVNELIRDGRRLVGSQFVYDIPDMVEIAGPANTNVSSWSLVFYGRIPNVNGNIDQGAVIGSAALSGTIPDQENGFGTLAFTFPPGTVSAGAERQQGGIAVVTGSGEVTNFISYYGSSLTAVSGPAAGLVALKTTTPGPPDNTNSIQLQGTGSIYTDFTWSPLFTKTPGQVNKAFINNKQVFVQPTFVNLSVSTNTITEGSTSNTLVATVTATRPVVGNQSVSIQGSGTNIDGNDFGLQFLTVTILSGATSGTTLVTIKNDTEVEGTETLRLTISRPSESIFLGTTTTQDITILDDDVPSALSVSPTALSFSAIQGSPSPIQSYVISATALTSGISVAATTGVEISQVSTGAGFTNAFSLSGSTRSATIYVRLSAGAPVGNAFTGTITNVSSSLTATVAVTGTISASTAPNQAPVAVSNANQTATVGTAFAYTVNAFTDPNNDALTYRASGLPAGLSFDAATRSITGTASASGVSTVTITATDPGGLSASTTFTITVNPAPVTPPANQAPVAVSNPNQTATVGTAFAYTVNAFTDPNNDALTYTVSGLPAGLSFDAATRSITGTASASGVSTVTITATDPGGLSASTTFTITVNPAPVTPPANQAPVAVSNANQTATVGTAFAYTVNAFTDPNGDALTYRVSGLPAGLSFDAATRSITGTASASGVSTVTITATDPGGLSASTTFTITVNPAPVTPPANQAPVAVSNANQTATVGTAFAYTVNAFTDPNNDALTYRASGLPAGLSFDAATRSITGTASASGVSTVTITATDPGGLSASTTFTITVNPAAVVNPPTPGSFAIVGVTTVNCSTVTASERRLTFTPQYAGATGQPVSFSVANELSPTTASGPYSLRVYTDNPVITLKANQAGTAGEASFTYNWLAACGGSSVSPQPTPNGFAITGATTVSCAAVTATERRLTFTPQYTGATGQPVSFGVLNELSATTASGPYTLRVYLDNPVITLKATQAGTPGEASFTYNWLAACGNPQARTGVAEPTVSLGVRVLGNPVQNRVEVEVTGAEGAALNVSLTNAQGRVIGQSRTTQAGAAERYGYDVSEQPAGVLLLRVNSGNQSRTVRVLSVK